MPNEREDMVAELEREKRHVETLYQLSQVVAQKEDLQEIVQLVTDEATELTGAEFGAFFYNVTRRDGQSYSLYALSGAAPGAFEKFPMPRATEIFRPTYEGMATVRLDDVQADPRYGRTAPYHGLPPGHPPVRSYLAVSVFASDGGVVGGLFFGHEQIGVFDEEDERIATGIATQAGTAIERARLLRAERDARAEAEARADAAVALEAVEDGVIMIDNEGVIRLWNRAAETITGLDADAVVGRRIGEALPAWERVALDVPVGELTETVLPATLPLDTLDGREVWLSLYGVAFGDRVVYAFRDVTGQRHLESLRADVVAIVSHELRTPITAVYGAAKTLRARTIEPHIAAKLLEIIDTESERLTVLVNDILLTSQIDSDAVTMSRIDVDPLEAIDAAVRGAGDTDGTLIGVDAPALAPRVAADGERLRQVLTNLIENALKYGTSNETPQVLVRLQESERVLRFEIADRGPGIPRHQQERIFEKFYRLDPDLTQGVRGTGLGLYISRELVRRMDGRIGVEPTVGGGATFWFELPRSDRGTQGAAR